MGAVDGRRGGGAGSMGQGRCARGGGWFLEARAVGRGEGGWAPNPVDSSECFIVVNQFHCCGLIFHSSLVCEVSESRLFWGERLDLFVLE